MVAAARRPQEGGRVNTATSKSAIILDEHAQILLGKEIAELKFLCLRAADALSTVAMTAEDVQRLIVELRKATE